jgi:hypothetical protein
MRVAATWPLSVAAEAAQAPKKTPRRWQDNKVITLGEDATTTGTGNHCGWTRDRIVHLAIMTALVKTGLPPSAAAKAASEYDQSQPGRDAGQPYPTGTTVMLYRGSDDSVVRNVDYDVSIFDLSNDDDVIVIVNLNRIIDRVDLVLNKFK